MMNMKSDFYVVAWLVQIVVTGCEVRMATNCEVENYIAMFIWCISDKLLHSISHPSPCLKSSLLKMGCYGTP